MRFPVTDEGWVVLGTPSEQTVAEAEARRARDDLHPPPTKIPFDVGSVQERARGYVAELGVRAWLEHLKVEHVTDGGQNPHPDITIGRVRVGVRCTRTRGRFKPSYVANIFEAHLGHADERCFVGYEVDADRYLLLGGVSEDIFYRARVARAGELVRGARHRYQLDCREILIAELEAPHLWIENIRARAGASAANLTTCHCGAQYAGPWPTCLDCELALDPK